MRTAEVEQREENVCGQRVHLLESSTVATETTVTPNARLCSHFLDRGAVHRSVRAAGSEESKGGCRARFLCEGGWY